MRKTIFYLVIFTNERGYRFFKKYQIKDGTLIGLRNDTIYIYPLKGVKDIWKIEKWKHNGIDKGKFTKIF